MILLEVSFVECIEVFEGPLSKQQTFCTEHPNSQSFMLVNNTISRIWPNDTKKDMLI